MTINFYFCVIDYGLHVGMQKSSLFEWLIIVRISHAIGHQCIHELLDIIVLADVQPPRVPIILVEF